MTKRDAIETLMYHPDFNGIGEKGQKTVIALGMAIMALEREAKKEEEENGDKDA